MKLSPTWGSKWGTNCSIVQTNGLDSKNIRSAYTDHSGLS